MNAICAVLTLVMVAIGARFWLFASLGKLAVGKVVLGAIASPLVPMLAAVGALLSGAHMGFGMAGWVGVAVFILLLPFMFGAALTAGKQTNLQGEPKFAHFAVKTNAKIFKGGLVCVDATGFAVAGADTAGNICVGVATETVDATGLASGAKNVEVAYDCIARLVGASLLQTSVGSNMFVTDDSSVDETTVNSIKVGKLMFFVSATEGLVFIPGLSDKI